MKATEAKLYPAAENILVGSETGAVAHVEDAFTGASLRKITVEGACKQDGTPSPDNPVPIQVVENPVLWVAGANLLNPTQLESTGYFYSAVNGEIQVNANDVRAWTSVAQYGVLPAGTYYIGGDSIEIMRTADNYSFAYTEGAMVNFKLATATSVKIKVGFGHPENQYPYVSHAMLLASSGKDVVYAPYVGTSTPITLPAEHPYLAKLPDGTADEIVVDEEGNVELVARVSKATIVASKIVNTWGKGYAIYAWPKDGRYSTGKYVTGKAVICQALEAADGGEVYKGSTVGISVGSSSAHVNQCDTVLCLGDGVDVSSIDGASFYYPLMTEKRYPLGKIEMPKTQNSIVNVWTDAEVTPNTSIEYTRDVNIVITNLESAIASITEG